MRWHRSLLMDSSAIMESAEILIDLLMAYNFWSPWARKRTFSRLIHNTPTLKPDACPHTHTARLRVAALLKLLGALLELHKQGAQRLDCAAHGLPDGAFIHR